RFPTRGSRSAGPPAPRRSRGPERRAGRSPLHRKAYRLRGAAAPGSRCAAPRDRAGAPEWARKSACPAGATCGRETENKSGMRSPAKRRRSRLASFGGRLIQLLFRPRAVRIQSQRLGESLPRLGVAILLAQSKPQPQVRFGVLRVQFDGLLEVG